MLVVLSSQRMVVGMWQVSGAHGYQVDARKAVSAMRDHYRSGLYCFDMADHYGPAEDLYGIFQTGLQADGGELGGQKPLGFTKWVPPPGEMSRRVVQENVDISLQRMKTDKLDMMQFHWWDYGDKRYIDALKHMTDMKAEGIINALSLTNFNADYLEYIVDQNQIPIATNQVSSPQSPFKPPLLLASSSSAMSWPVSSKSNTFKFSPSESFSPSRVPTSTEPTAGFCKMYRNATFGIVTLCLLATFWHTLRRFWNRAQPPHRSMNCLYFPCDAVEGPPQNLGSGLSR